MAKRTRKLTVPGFVDLKSTGRKICVLTAYDYPTARIADRAGADVILVGDSVANVVLGIGLGAVWAYVVLGWGGYWAWDPVENASLIPWLVGTATIHTMMAWRHRGGGL